MKKDVLIENPKYFEGTPDLPDQVTLVFANNYLIVIDEHFLKYSNVQEKLLSLKKGDTIYFEPKNISTWSSKCTMVGASFLKSNGTIIIDYKTNNEANSHSSNKIILLLFFLLLFYAIRYLIKNRGEYFKSLLRKK